MTPSGSQRGDISVTRADAVCVRAIPSQEGLDAASAGPPFPAPPTSTARYPASQHCGTGGGNDVGG
jgi:hypothetical protein